MLKKVACILLLVACDGDEVSTTSSEPAPAVAPPAPAPAAPPVAPVTATTTDEPAAPAAATAANAPAPAPAQVATASRAWRDRVAAEVAALRASSPQLLAELTALAPAKTRAGHVRFTSDAIHDPRAASVFLDRLARGGESEDVRAALVEALPRTGGAFADAAVELFGSESSALVRGSYVFAARRAPAPQAIALVKRGLADAAAPVQAEAARTAAAHASGAQVAAELRAALAAPDPAVRSEVARTLGLLKITDARDQLVPLLGDTSADVRLESLRAIDRIQPGFAKTLPLDRLAADSDPRVVALVSRLRGASAAPAPTSTQSR